MIFPAEGHRCRRDAARPKGAMHPHPAHPGSSAILHQFFSLLRRGHRYYPVHRLRQMGQIGIAGISLHRFSVGVKGIDRIAGTFQFTVNRIRRFVWPTPGYPGHSNFLLS